MIYFISRDICRSWFFCISLNYQTKQFQLFCFRSKCHHHCHPEIAHKHKMAHDKIILVKRFIKRTHLTRISSTFKRTRTKNMPAKSPIIRWIAYLPRYNWNIGRHQFSWRRSSLFSINWSIKYYNKNSSIYFIKQFNIQIPPTSCCRNRHG